MQLSDPANDTPRPPPAEASVLLVDGTPANLSALRAILGELDSNLVEARSGEEALELMRASEFAVVLLDVRLPGRDGFETAKLVRQIPRASRTPIIFLSTDEVDGTHLERGYELGAIDFFVRPLVPAAVRAKVRGFVELFLDKKQAVLEREQARRESEQLRLLVHGTKDYAIFMLDPAGRIATWNAGAERLKGYAAHEIIGQHFSRFYPDEANARGWPAHELKVAAADGRFEDEGWRVRKDGSRFWANVVITALRDESGELRGFSKVTRDLTARKAAEEKLRQSEERFRLLVEGAKDYAIFLLDPTGHVASWNPGAERIKGYAADDIIGRHFSRFYPNEVAERGWPEHELEVAAAEGRFEDEGWRVRKDGTQFWANVVITALKDDDGRLLGYSKITRDLTDRKNAEEAGRRLAAEQAARTAAEAAQAELRASEEELRQQREWLAVTLASIGDAVITTDTAGRVTFLNPVAEQLTGWPEADARGRPLAEVFPITNEQTGRPVESPVDKVIREGTIVGLANHTVLAARDGVVRPIDDSAAPIRDSAGALVGVVLIFRDVSASRRTDRQREARSAVTHTLVRDQTAGFASGGSSRHPK